MSSFAASFNREKYFLLTLFFLSFFIRAFFFSFLIEDKKYWVCKDSAEYHEVATRIAKGEGILNAGGEQTFFRVPGSSLFLALFYKLFSFEVTKTLWVQIFLSSFIPLLVFFLSLIFFPGNFLLARITSVFIALNIGAVVNSALLMSDSLFVLFFLIFALLFFPNFELFFCRSKSDSFSWQKFFIAGIFLGVASLIRPVGHYIIFLSVILLFLSDFIFSEKIKSGVSLFLGWFLIVFWWLLRNWLLTGAVIFHCMPGIHFLTYLACEVDSQANKCNYSDSKDKLFKKWENLILELKQKKCATVSEFEKAELASQVAFETVKKYPFETVKHCFVNLFKTCFSLHSGFLVFLLFGTLPSYQWTTTFWDKIKFHLFLSTQNQWVRFVLYLEIFLLLTLLIGFVGFLISAFIRRELWCKILKVLPFVCLFVFLTFGSGVARLRLPVEPFIIIFSLNFWLGLLFKRGLNCEEKI